MKVCYIMGHTGEEFGITSDYQYSRHFGYEQLYCKAAMKQGIDTTLIVLSYRPGITRFRHIFGHQIIKMPVTVSFGVSRQISLPLLKYLETDLADTDLFHIHSYHALEYEPLALLLKKEQKKFVAQSHSAHYSLTNPIHLARLSALFFSLRLSNGVLSVNPQEYLLLKKLYRIKNSILFPNGIDTTIFRSLNRTKKTRSLLFIGRLWPDKGLPILLDAFKRLQKDFADVSLTIVGKGPLIDLVLEAKKTYPNVQYWSYVTETELVELYNTHELFVLPSLNEPFGLVVLESLSCNTPVVTAANCGAAYFVNKFGCIELFQPGNHLDLYKKIHHLFSNPQKLTHMSYNARDSIVENFDWTIIGEKLTALYHEIINKY